MEAAHYHEIYSFPAWSGFQLNILIADERDPNINSLLGVDLLGLSTALINNLPVKLRLGNLDFMSLQFLFVNSSGMLPFVFRRNSSTHMPRPMMEYLR